LVRSVGTHNLAVSDTDLVVPAPFSLAINSCRGNVLSFQQECEFELRFSPTATGKFDTAQFITKPITNAPTASALQLQGRTPVLKFVEVVAGTTHTFARRADGTWWATGVNTSGQLGLGDTVNRTAFTLVPALNGATKVVVGRDFTFARMTNGQWRATGNNNQGQ